MSSKNPRVKARGSRLLAFATSLLVAGSGAIIAPAAAQAVSEGDLQVTSGQLSWGTISSWQRYIDRSAPAGGVAFHNGASSNGVPGEDNYNWGTGATGVFNPASQQGSFDVPGAIQWTYPSHGLDTTFSGLSVDFNLATGTGQVLGDYTGKSPEGASVNGDNVQLATFTVPAGTTANNGQINVVNAAAIGGPGLDSALMEGYAGNPVMSVSFNVNYAAPAASTTVTLQADKTEADVNSEFIFTASVSPADAAGTVQFFSNNSVLGAPVVVTNGTAVANAQFGAAGPQAVTAEFIPADPAVHTGSTSNVTNVTVVVPPDAVATTLTLDPVVPAKPAKLGTEVTLSATVAQATGATIPAGNVKFYATNEALSGDAARTLVGDVTTTDGKATVKTTELAVGGNTFTAEFVPADGAAFQASTATLERGLGIYDPAGPAFCEIPAGSGSVADTEASLTWAWSAYANTPAPFPPGSTGWVKTGTGDISVDGSNFVFTGGNVVANGNCAVISFEGTARVTAYGDPYTELTDPQVVVSADGSAVLRASVESQNGESPVFTSDGVVTIAQFNAPAALVPGADVAAAFASEFDGTVTAGSWSPGYTGAWANSFIGILDPAQQAFYYRSGDSASQDRKPASPLELEFNWPAVSTMELVASPEATVAAGTATTLTANVTPAADVAGTVEFISISAKDSAETVLGSAIVENGVASVTTTLPAGGHTFRAEFTSSNVFSDATASITKNYGVAQVSNVPACVADANQAETLTGFTTRWGWNEYGNSADHTGGSDLNWPKFAEGDIRVEGTDFVLSNGVAQVTDNCVSVSFTGTMRVEAYQSWFPEHGQWIEVLNPVLTIDANGNGTWSGGVRTGAGALSSAEPVNTVIATISGAQFPQINGTSFAAEIGLDYTDTVAPGTWAVKDGTAFTSAWANGFILQVPAAIKSFYYASGAGGDVKKAPLPLNVAWQMAEPTAAIAGGATVTQGADITFRAEGFRAGSSVDIAVYSDPVQLGASTASRQGVVERVWTVPTDFPAGNHTVRFTDANGQTASAEFTVVNAEAPAAVAEVCVARSVTGGTMNWALKESFRNYANGPIAKGSFSGGAFTVSGGSVNVAEGGIGRVEFAGAISVTGHNGKLNFQLSNPTIQITGQGTGVLFAQVASTKTTGEVAVNGRVALANLNFAGPVINGNTLSVNGATVTLTAAGAQAFGGFYKSGEALDPISFTATLGGEVACDSTTDPVLLAATGGNNDMPLLAGMGIVTLLLGAGFVLARRRMSSLAE